jgi:hypothetical protein
MLEQGDTFDFTGIPREKLEEVLRMAMKDYYYDYDGVTHDYAWELKSK